MKETAAQVRYWIPEGYETEEGLRADVRSFARRGFGAVELVAVNFFVLGFWDILPRRDFSLTQIF